MNGDLSFDVTSATFDERVMQRSATVPVVIDLWAAWCEPCKQLTPVLETLVQEYEGTWVLAKIDVDAEPQIAAAFQVQSIPSVFAAVRGQVAPLFQGALPEATVREVLDQLLQVSTAQVATSSPSAGQQDAGVESPRSKSGVVGYESAGGKSQAGNTKTPPAKQGSLGYGAVKGS